MQNSVALLTEYVKSLRTDNAELFDWLAEVSLITINNVLLEISYFVDPLNIEVQL